MFTGIIEEVGTIRSISTDRITISCKEILKDCKIGDSIAVNGVCLTVVEFGKDYFCADVSKETYKVTAFSDLKIGNIVNLERALTLSSRLGGHIVSGHTDTVGKIIDINKLSEFYEFKIGFNKEYSKYVAKKGSITVNGISLTVADCSQDFVTIAIIPHTFDMTVLRVLKVGDNVNLEFDILAKYVEKFLSSSDNNSITVNFLAENGFC